MTTKDELIRLISELVEIESINTWLIPGGSGEKAVQTYIRAYLERLGLPSELEQVDDGHWNLTATLKGKGGGKNLTLYAHADTVGCELWADRALIPELRGDRLVGLGAADDKGMCAAAMLTVKKLIERDASLAGDVHLCFVSDEEGASCGAMDYVEKHAPEATLILEPAPLEQVCVTHQGFGWLRITTRGKAGHGSAGGTSADAIYHMAEVIVRLQQNQRETFAKAPHPMNGETVYHTGTISGGTDFASYPEKCVLGIEIGTQPGETIQDRIDEIEEIFREIQSFCPAFDGRVETIIARAPFAASGHEELYGIVAESIEKHHGKPAAAVGENSWGDSQLFQDAGFPTLGLGALGGNLHAPDEWISIQETEALIKVLSEAVEKYCG
jgi:acetylornithine deacetylase